MLLQRTASAVLAAARQARRGGGLRGEAPGYQVGGLQASAAAFGISDAMDAAIHTDLPAHQSSCAPVARLPSLSCRHLAMGCASVSQACVSYSALHLATHRNSLEAHKREDAEQQA